MDIITTHLNADFDGLASMLAARHIYPEALMVFPGSQERSIRNFFLHSYSYAYPFKKLKEIDLKQVTRLIIVDTRQKERIGQFAKLVDRPEVEVCLYDHHPDSPGDITASLEEVIEPVGATVTIMVELLRQKNLKILADEATAMMIGIYEDTGSLTYNTTSVRDFQAAAYLLQQGANLQMVADVINTTLDRSQVSLLNDLLLSAREVIIHGQPIVMVEANRDLYVPEAALIVHRLRDMEKISVLFALIRMERKVYLIARSRNQHVDAGHILEHFGGGGHQSAAAAVAQELTLIQCREELLVVLEKEVEPSLIAADLMTSPILTVNEDANLADAASLLTKYNINVLPVVDNDNHTLCGIITRQVVEKGVYHGLKQVPVRDYMTTDYQPVHKDADLLQIQEMIVERNQRFLPVIDAQNMVIGAITRKDLLGVLHDQAIKGSEFHGEAGSSRKMGIKNAAPLLREQFSKQLMDILHKIGDLADELGVAVFLVGGVVRDLLRRQKNLDIDIVVEGDGIALARVFAKRYHYRCHIHSTFQTAVIIFPDGFKIDVASARMEYYDTPASLPKVSGSSLKVDLYRRDFTINTLVICLNRKRFGEMQDHFGAFRDLKEKSIRVLHNLSFVEDPTRIFRAIRFEQKFGFSIGRQTVHLINNAIKMSFIDRLSGVRIIHELKMICAEINPLPIFQRLHHFGILQQVFPGINCDVCLKESLPAIRDVISWYEYLFLDEKIEKWQIYLLGILNDVEHDLAASLVNRLNLEQSVFSGFLDRRRQGIKAAKELTTELLANRQLQNSLLVNVLSSLPVEIILYILADHSQREVKRAISNYITTLQFIRPELSGDDLIAMGLEPGPEFKFILNHLKNAKLNGEIKGRDNEIRLVQKWLQEKK